MKKLISILLAILAMLTLSACGDYGDPDTEGDTAGDTYNVSGTNNKVFIINDNGTRECYDLDANGSACNQDFEVTIEVIEEHSIGDGHTDPALCPFALANLEAQEALENG